MSALNPAGAEATMSTFDQIKDTAKNSVNWLGRQASVIKDYVFAAIAKIVAFIKPLMSNIAKVFGETYDKVREYVIANKEIAVPAGIVGILAVFGTLVAYFLCCKPDEADPAPVNSLV